MGQGGHKPLLNVDDSFEFTSYAHFKNGGVSVFLVRCSDVSEQDLQELKQLGTVWAMRDYFGREHTSDSTQLYSELADAGVTLRNYDMRGTLRDYLAYAPDVIYNNAIDYQLPFVLSKVEERNQSSLLEKIKASVDQSAAVSPTSSDATETLRKILSAYVASEATYEGIDEQTRVFLFDDEGDAAAIADTLSRCMSVVGEVPEPPQTHAERSLLLE